MGVGGYATPLTIRYLGSDVSLRSGFNSNNTIRTELKTFRFVVTLMTLVTES
jgi:hypothetical protein